MTIVSDEKNNDHFFASMAQKYSEQASQLVSRSLHFSLTPVEKPATLAQPLKKNISQSAQVYTVFHNLRRN